MRVAVPRPRMYSKFWAKGGAPGILHHYTETNVAFEFVAGAAHKPNSILFIGGLGDGLATTSYVADLVQALEPTEWSLFSLTLTSSYQAWGLGHLDRDTDEVARCLEYIQEYKTSKFGNNRVVLMGHSTGSQNVLHYLHRPNPHTSKPRFDQWLQHIKRPALDGAIMQAPVSDREALLLVLEEGMLGNSPSECRAIYNKLIAMAREASKHDDAFDLLLPISLTSQLGYPADTAVSCRRFLSLASPDSPQAPEEDDLFSSDLSADRISQTFGLIHERKLLKGRLLVLSSGADQSVPPTVDKNEVLSRWKVATDHNGRFQIWDSKHSGVIPGASHALSNDDQAEPRADLCRRVLGYIHDIDN